MEDNTPSIFPVVHFIWCIHFSIELLEAENSSLQQSMQILTSDLKDNQQLIRQLTASIKEKEEDIRQIQQQSDSSAGRHAEVGFQ